MGSIVFWAKITQTNYQKRAEIRGIPQLLTIPYSHFNEFAKWCLQFAGKPYEEHGFAPGQHVLPVLALRVSTSTKHLSSTSYVQVVTSNSGETSTKDSVPEALKKDRRGNRARATAVPVMVLPTGEVLSDSWSIAQYCGMTLPPSDVMDLYDNQLGPLGRQFAYAFLLKDSHQAIWNGLVLQDKGWFFRIVWNFGLSSIITKRLKGIFKPDNRDDFVICREKLVKLFSKLDERITNKKGKYINGDAISMEDFCLASFAAVVVMPENYVQGKYKTYFKMLEDQDDELKRELEYFRNTEVGKYTIALYKECR